MRGALPSAALPLNGRATAIARPAIATVAIPAAANDDRDCAGQRSLRLTNGRIHTMDNKDTVVSSVLIVIANLLVDVFYSFLDPRVSVG